MTIGIDTQIKIFCLSQMAPMFASGMIAAELEGEHEKAKIIFKLFHERYYDIITNDPETLATMESASIDSIVDNMLKDTDKEEPS